MAAVAAVLWGACVPYPGDPDLMDRPSTLDREITQGTFPGLDAGANELQSLHFLAKAYGPDTVRQVSDQAEQAYQRIMTDTGLYSFRPRDLYRVVIYGTQDEYRKKTGQAEWSSGCSIGNSIYSFLQPRLESVLSHEMTHLIWFEFMTARAPVEHRWINEGLAVYEEAKAESGRASQPLFAQMLPALRSQPMPMDQMQHLVPATERAYQVSLWYAQAESLVRFMVERGGRIGFAQFLNALRDGRSLDEAVNSGFPGQWRAAVELENDWRRSLL